MEENEELNPNLNDTAEEQSVAIKNTEGIETGNIRDEQGRWIKGVSGNPEGRPTETEEEKIKRQALKEIKENYINRLTEALPKIDPVLIQKGIDGDLIAIKEINDRVLGKSRMTVGLDGGEEGKAIKIENVSDEEVKKMIDTYGKNIISKSDS